MKSFSPARLGYYLTDRDRCLKEYSPTLDIVDELFGKDTATSILQEMYLSLYRLSTIKEQFSIETARVAASVFFGTYRTKCNLYQMMIYFAMYPTHFKGTYFQFDTTDILRQYGAKFLPWYQSQTTEEEEQPKQTFMAHEPRGLEARDIYIKDCIRNGIEVRDGGLYKFGFITEWELQHLEHEFGK